MFEFFKDSPALQWMEDSVRQEEQRKADTRVLAEQKKAEQRLREAQRKELATFHQMVIVLIDK